jgi:hypothetical protein
MAFVPLQPRISRALTGINVAWRATSNRQYNVLVVSFAAATLQDLGWQEYRRVKVQFCDETARLQLVPSTVAGQGFALTRRNSTGKAPDAAPRHMNIILPDIHGEARAAKPVAWERHDDGIMVHLPDWARHPRHSAAVKRVATGPGMPVGIRAA